MSARDDLTELLAVVRGDDFVFDPSRLAYAEEMLQYMIDRVPIDPDQEDALNLAVCALKTLYRTINATVSA